MRAIMVMYDTLRFDVLPNYGGSEAPLPNFQRLADKTVTFDTSYVCSLPCMPARRELHTGRPNFLHRGWGPIEPFDDSMPELLKRNGIYSHLVTDHNHYVEDGGGTYHTRFSSWECNRGQEGDPWCGSAEPRDTLSPHVFPAKPGQPASIKQHLLQLGGQDRINRRKFKSSADYPMHKTFDGGIEFIENNLQYDNWFLQIETFDPHEPFDVPNEYVKAMLDPDGMTQVDWPPYAPVEEDAGLVDEVRKKYLALVTFCDAQLGRVLDAMDRYDMWKDTMLIVNTDHGFMLSEHNWWGKMSMPDYEEIVHTPLFIWDPTLGHAGERRDQLVQTIDIAPTLLDYFGVEIPADMLGKSIRSVIRDGAVLHEYGIFGAFGSVLNITDGRYVYMLAPADEEAPSYEYTHMPTHMRARFSVQEMQELALAEPFSFTKGCKVMKIRAGAGGNVGTRKGKVPTGEYLLFDVKADPKQMTPLHDEAVIKRMRGALRQVLQENDAPAELYTRYGL